MVAPVVMAGLKLGAGAAAKGNEGSVGGSANTGFIGKTLGIQAGLEARDRKADERRQREYEEMMRVNDAFNYGEGKRALERIQDTAPDFAGKLSSEYLTPDMLGSTTREDLGGAAFEQVLNSASGYNPVVASSPYMNMIGSQAAQQGYLKDLAAYNTERTLSGYEDRAQDRASQYTEAAGRLQDDRETMFDTYRDSIESSRDEGQETFAQNIVDTWIASNDAAGAAGNVEFINRRGRNDNYGKTLGTHKDKKRDYVNQLLASGHSYSDLLSDPEFVKYIQADTNARPLYGQWGGAQNA